MPVRSSSFQNVQWIGVFLLLGLAISVAMVARGQAAGDQLNLLGLGWHFAFEGKWVPHGNPTSGGGVTPGGITSLLVGLPLILWRDYRSPAVLVFLSHLLAYLLLDRLIRRILGPEERFLFAVLYWLNPWRIYHSGFLWNPNYLFLLAALHIWTAYLQRHRASPWLTAAHVLVLGMALQIEIVALPLLVSSLLLWWKGYMRVHLGGAIGATLIIGLTLLPWALLVARDPSLLPKEEGFIGRGLVVGYPLVRGVFYWLRYSSLALSKEIFCLDYSNALGEATMARFSPFLEGAKRSIYWLTVPLALWANYRLCRDSGDSWRGKLDTSASDRVWLEGVIRWSFLGGLIVFALAPTNIMRWHVLSLFHVAVLPLVLAGAGLLRGRWSKPSAKAVWVYTILSIVVAVAVLFGSPTYRCGGDRCDLKAVTMPRLRADHPMLEVLGIQESCPVVVNDPEGWWPSTFGESPSAPSAPD